MRNTISKGKRVLKIVFIAIFAARLLTVYINDQLRLNAEAELRSPLGRMVEADGHNMSIYVEGNGETTRFYVRRGYPLSHIGFQVPWFSFK